MSEHGPASPPVTVGAGEIQFAEACLPPLAAGEYEIAMRQTVRLPPSADASGAPAPRIYDSKLVVAVDAPRFTLAPSEIYSVFPPINQKGGFDVALPHVVFSRRTLPWERRPDKGAPVSECQPWLAIVLLRDDELSTVDASGATRAREARPLPVVGESGQDSLLFPSSSNVCCPRLGQERGQRAWDRHRREGCLALDLPASVFQAVAPRKDDLPFLAHVRQVDTGDKEVFAVNDRGWFSLVMGNRLPSAGKEHRAFLVSLEGMLDYLPGGRLVLGDDKLVRLAVLCSWRFTCAGSDNFKARVDGLRIGSLREPSPEIDDRDTLDPDNIVERALARGYTALNHVLRHGEKTVSWYRGPLVPLLHAKPKLIQEPVACADALMQYDPDTGLFNVSHASAWQLGRLLALQNQSFAVALNRSRAAVRNQAGRNARRRESAKGLAASGLGGGADTDTMEQRWMDALLADGGGNLLDPARRATPQAVGRPLSNGAVGGADADQAGATYTDRLQSALAGDKPPAPAEQLSDVTNWLGRLMLLYGVPFDYLLPREAMLPGESLRFFFLDPIWIQYLLQGACSVGNVSHGDMLVDRVMNEWIQPTGPESQESAVLAQAARVRDQLRKQYEGAAPAQTPARLDWPLTGFLLRSEVVAGWRGLEIEAYSRGPEVGARYPEARFRLRTLRIEQISPDVLLALFGGTVAYLVIRQPRESLHFGLTANHGAFYKTLRNPRDASAIQAAPPVTGKVHLHSPDLIRADSRVIEIAKLAAEMKQQLAAHLVDGKFTSAEFAVQMIEPAGEFVCLCSRGRGAAYPI